ncbi:MAG: DUF1573 domain-containing protein [Bacteroidia bacterium]
MKKIIALCALVAGFAFSSRAQESVVPTIDPNAPEIKFESEVIDYGTIDYDANGIREFKFKNVGKSPLTVSNVQGECGCTSTTIDGKPGWPQEPILPGKSGVIRVKYDTKRPGRFEKNVTVTTNGKLAAVKVKIKGEIKAAPADQTTPPGK